MKLKYTFTTSNVLDQIVAVPTGDDAADCNLILSLNEIAADILMRLQEGKPKETVVDELLTEYDATRPQIEEEVTKVIAVLDEKNLIVEH